MTQTDDKKAGWVSLVVLLLTTLLPSGIVAFLIRDSTQVYETLTKPAFAPPGWLFPVVWTLLYILMALSIWFVLRAGGENATILVLYYVQLAVNLVWPILFFTQQAFGLSFVWLVLLLALILILSAMAFRRSRLAGWLLTPYLAWVVFAGVLNFAIARLNPS